jgi:Skp family chaperone for outer membrane proteins
VLVFYGHLLFAAKVLKIEPEREGPKIFYIHYVGWTKRHDTWVGIDLMNKSNPDNIKYQKELEEQMLAEREAKKKMKQLEREQARRKKQEAKKKEKEAMKKKNQLLKEKKKKMN